MDIRLNLWFLRHRLDYVFGHVAGMGRSESNSLDAVNCRHGFEQCAEAELLVAIGVYGLAEQDDFFDSAGSQLANFAQNVAGGNAAFAPAHVWNHAEGAKLVTSAHYRYIRPHAIVVFR